MSHFRSGPVRVLVILSRIYVSDSSWGVSAASTGAIIQRCNWQSGARRCPWEPTIHNPLKANIRYQKIRWDKRRVCEKRARWTASSQREVMAVYWLLSAETPISCLKQHWSSLGQGGSAERQTLSYQFQGHTQVHRERGEARRGETQDERSKWGQGRTGALLLKEEDIWGNIFWGKRVHVVWKQYTVIFSKLQTSFTVEWKEHLLKLSCWNI